MRKLLSAYFEKLAIDRLKESESALSYFQNKTLGYEAAILQREWGKLYHEISLAIYQPKKLKYTLVWDDTIGGLSEQVETLMQDGWKLQGGVSVVRYNFPGYNGNETAYEYHQAMTREPK